jgi:signal transduction histidine kinase
MRSWARNHRPELAWSVWAAANLGVTAVLLDYETVPFHFIWVSLTLVYGWRVWPLAPTLATLGGVCVTTALVLGWGVHRGAQTPDELTEVPLMAAMFLAMVWHARRRQAALDGVHQAAGREREFVRAASHQLKTPIAIARGLASLIRVEQKDEAATADIDDLVEELDRLSRLAEDLLLLAAAEQYDSLIRNDVDFEDLIVGAVARRWGRTEDRSWSIVACEGVLRNADRHRLDSALDALLENAVRATRAGERIAVRGCAEGDIAVIEVTDGGAGIPHEALPHVFERFWSAPYQPDDGRRGTGLGLSIVEAVVSAHGGRVAIESTAGHGSTVRIRLPGFRATPALEPAGGASSAGSSSTRNGA